MPRKKALYERVVTRRQTRKRIGWGIAIVVILGLSIATAWALTKQQEALVAADFARTEQGRANREAENARVQADTAIAAKNRAERSDQNARLQADTARMERDNARAERDRANREARDARAAELATKAQQVIPQDNTLALNLAMAAYRLSPTEEVITALHDIVSDDRGIFYMTMADLEGAVGSVAFSPDGQTIASSNGAGLVKLWNLQGEELFRNGSA